MGSLHPPPDFKKPPGTVRLIRENGELDTPQLVLQPAPSEDPNDPLNWPMWRKMMNFIPILAITTVIFTQTSVSLIFWVLWVPEFGWSLEDLNAAQATMLAGIAVGCFFFIPPAVKYGRRSSYILMIAITAATALWSAKMNSIAELYISGFFFGMATSTNETIVEMTIADLFFVHQRATANAVYMVTVIAGNFLTPIAAGYMAADGDWRICYWALFATEVLLLLYFIFLFEETKYVPCIAGRAEDQRVVLPTSSVTSVTDKIVDSQMQVNAEEPSREELLRQQTRATTQTNPNIPMRPWKERLRLITKTDESLLSIVRESVVILFKFPAVPYTGLTYAFSVCWIQVQATATSIVFATDPYNFGPAGIALMSLPVFVGAIIGSIYAAFSDKTVQWQARRNHGYYEPEMRLHMNHLPAICMGGGIIMFGATAAQGMDWIYPAIGAGVFGFGLAALGDVAITYLIDSYQGLTGEAFISVAFLRNLFSVAISFALVPWLNAQGLQNMTLVQGVFGIALAFIYIPLIKWGKRIRERTATQYAEMVHERGGNRL